MNPLALIPTEDLIHELLARHDHGAIALLKVGMAGDDVAMGKVTKLIKWRGNSETCVGLCAYAQHRIIESYLETAEDIAP